MKLFDCMVPRSSRKRESRERTCPGRTGTPSTAHVLVGKIGGTPQSQPTNRAYRGGGDLVPQPGGYRRIPVFTDG